MDITTIKIRAFKLKWSDWFEWNRIYKDAWTDQYAVDVPDKPGVYEVKYRDEEKRLMIGKASNLQIKLKQGLVQGKIPHATGDRLREKAGLDRIVIRWVETDRPACVEEELHIKHIELFGSLPTYTKRHSET